jgi:hypothetical protein
MNANKAINSIEDAVEELKCKRKLTDIAPILANFTWTREWFRSAEEVLLDLAYRDESDSVVVDFIRKKIIDIDVVEFNDILSKFGAERITNHYEWLLQSDINLHYLVHLYNNSIVRRLMQEGDNYLRNSSSSSNQNNTVPYYRDMSSNQNDMIVDYLIKNPENIRNEQFLSNCNDRAVAYSLSHILPKYLEMDGHEFAISCLSVNSNDKAVDIILSNKYLIDDNFSHNTNDRAVKYLLTAPQKIDWEGFSSNPNDHAVDYMLENPDKIVWSAAALNSNPRMAKLVLSRLDDIKEVDDIMPYLSINDSDVIVDYLLANQHQMECKYFVNNENDRALEYIMQNPKKFNYRKLADNNCQYNMQKFRAFNALKLFPQLPHFTVRM